MTESLKIVKAKLRRRMDSRDTGFIYESTFGADKRETHYMPHVLVRVELRSIGDGFYRFEVFVDFHLPIGVDIENIKYFNGAVQSATKKALWAHKIISGFKWHRNDIFTGKISE